MGKHSNEPHLVACFRSGLLIATQSRKRTPLTDERLVAEAPGMQAF
jgi:hypothetical protein